MDFLIKFLSAIPISKFPPIIVPLSPMVTLVSKSCRFGIFSSLETICYVAL